MRNFVTGFIAPIEPFEQTTTHALNHVALTYEEVRDGRFGKSLWEQASAAGMTEDEWRECIDNAVADIEPLDLAG